MPALQSKRFVEQLHAIARVYGRELTSEAVMLYLIDLGNYTETQVLTALQRCRRELNHFPVISDIISKVPGEHPNAEEAWSLIPVQEEQSTFWTDEIASAYGSVRELLERDEMAARMSFKEIYTRLVGEARARGKLPRWMPSFGTDRDLRHQAVEQAVAKGRITAADAQKLLPEPVAPVAPASRQLEAPRELKPLSVEENLKRIRAIRESLSKGERK